MWLVLNQKKIFTDGNGLKYCHISEFYPLKITLISVIYHQMSIFVYPTTSHDYKQRVPDF